MSTQGPIDVRHAIKQLLSSSRPETQGSPVRAPERWKSIPTLSEFRDKVQSGNNEGLEPLPTSSLATASPTATLKALELPLGHAWVLTYSPPVVYSSNTSETYTENIVTLGGFSTVQSWARHFNNLPVPSKLPRGSNYHLFKKGIRPLFEDPANKAGGRWVLNLRNHAPELLDVLWKEIMMALVGEIIELTGEGIKEILNGLVVSPRGRGDRIQLWINRIEPVEMIDALGKKFISGLGGLIEEGTFTVDFQINTPPLIPSSTSVKYLSVSKSIGLLQLPQALSYSRGPPPGLSLLRSVSPLSPLAERGA